ncbi:unnamed protein product [Sympodiomycopsis kandeliae]
MTDHPLENVVRDDEKHSNNNNNISQMKTTPTEPRSAYYTGPPPKESAFGTSPAGQVGVDRPREIVRIERDYSISPSHIAQYYPSFPLELENRITPTQFSDMINDINALLIEANNPKWAALDNGLAILTLWISPWITGSYYQRKMKQFQTMLDQFNTRFLDKNGLHIRHPETNAWLFLEMEYY